MSGSREIRKRILQQQPVCTCEMCECDPAQETTITIEEQE